VAYFRRLGGISSHVDILQHRRPCGRELACEGALTDQQIFSDCTGLFVSKLTPTGPRVFQAMWLISAGSGVFRAMWIFCRTADLVGASLLAKAH
ncbi:hypothetical protein, partial [Pseudomonas syringae]|uniref:hypothetical protein n=1 Tax=Pseudomonas syringae TaxID=317 RepID=UPI001E62B0D8